MTVKEFIEQVQLINKDEVIESIGMFGGVNRIAEFCIHTNKGEYDIGFFRTPSLEEVGKGK